MTSSEYSYSKNGLEEPSTVLISRSFDSDFTFSTSAMTRASVKRSPSPAKKWLGKNSYNRGTLFSRPSSFLSRMTSSTSAEVKTPGLCALAMSSSNNFWSSTLDSPSYMLSGIESATGTPPRWMCYFRNPTRIGKGIGRTNTR